MRIGRIAIHAFAKHVELLSIQFGPHAFGLFLRFRRFLFGGLFVGDERILFCAAKLNIFHLLAQPQIAAGGFEATV